jgi:hypothetical protein
METIFLGLMFCEKNSQQESIKEIYIQQSPNYSNVFPTGWLQIKECFSELVLNLVLQHLTAVTKVQNLADNS